MVGIIAGYSTANKRHMPSNIRTQDLLAEAIVKGVEESGKKLDEIDGLAVSSFTLQPDKAIDLAWRLGLKLKWLAEDNHGGVGGANLLRAAQTAIEAGQAKHVVIVAGDHLPPAAFKNVADNYNTATQNHLSPIPHGGPNPMFAMMTKKFMEIHELQREDMGSLAISQRLWAMNNPRAVYRSELHMEEYLDGRVVFDPLTIYDCVPVVSGAEALVLSQDITPGKHVKVLAQEFIYNIDDQLSDGLLDNQRCTDLADRLYNSAAISPQDIDVVGVYDDYPVMAIEQARLYGFVDNGDIKKYLHDKLRKSRFAVNTSGGQLSAGQAGCAAGLHFIVEATRQLLAQAGGRQVENANFALVSNYGMVTYRHGACLAGTILEGG